MDMTPHPATASGRPAGDGRQPGRDSRAEPRPLPRPMPREALIGLLNELLEGERAGVKAALLCRDDTAHPGADATLHAVSSDEGHFCSMLVRHIERLDATPSRATGSFHEKLRALPDLAQRLQFLNRGQRWVVRRLNEALPAIRDGWLKADLEHMRDVHERNIARCAAVLAQIDAPPPPPAAA